MNKTEFQFMIFILTVLHACSSPPKKKKKNVASLLRNQPQDYKGNI